MDYKHFEKTAKEIHNYLKTIPNQWNGRDAIFAMKEGESKHWKQMEWIGFYFEFICENELRPLDFSLPKKLFSLGNVKLDGFHNIPWDLKTHVINNASNSTQVIVNDREAIEEAIKKYDCIGLIICLGNAVYNDEDGEFKKWHDVLKGEISNYVEEGIKKGRPSRRRKVSFSLEKIAYVKMDEELFELSGGFQEGFINSNGSKRRTKVLLDLKNLVEGKNVYYGVYSN